MPPRSWIVNMKHVWHLRFPNRAASNPSLAAANENKGPDVVCFYSTHLSASPFCCFSEQLSPIFVLLPKSCFITRVSVRSCVELLWQAAGVRSFSASVRRIVPLNKSVKICPYVCGLRGVYNQLRLDHFPECIRLSSDKKVVSKAAKHTIAAICSFLGVSFKSAVAP